MANNPEPNEFVSKLISEMFDAITTAQFDQEKRLAELAEASALSAEEFGKRYVTDEHVYAELIQLFPGNSTKYPTSIYVGAPYRPPAGNADESPPIEAVSGVRLEKNDYGRKREKTILKESAVKKINAAVRNSLSRSQLAAIAQVLNRGMPRVIADSGKMNAKLTYEVISTEEAEQPERKKRILSPLKGKESLGALQKSSALSRFHLVVRQADERAPQTPNLKVNVFGEVEITFKTIV